MAHITIDARMIESSGIGTYIQNLVPLLIRNQPNYSFSLIGDLNKFYKHSWTSGDNIELISASSPIYSIREQFDILQKIPKRTDLLWVPHYNIPVLYRGKLMVTVHDLLHLAMPQFVQGFHRRYYAKFMFGMLAKRAEKVVTVSNFTKGELSKYTSIPVDKVIVASLGVNEKWYHIEKRNKPNERPYILFVGNVKPHKNLSRLIRAFENKIDEFPHDLIIVGAREGLRTTDIDAERIASTLKDRVLFTGSISEEKLEQYYAYADLLAFPSLYEGFGLPPLEAMACGCPVLSSNKASLPEVCGEAVLYCDPDSVDSIAEKLTAILGNVNLRAELREKGREHVMNFSWETCAIEVEKAIKQVLQA
jgi:glycosyltransferase involved in cell wall biosynthesis